MTGMISPQFKGRKSGGEQRTPTRVADTLRADDTVELLLAISEGEIEGLDDAVEPRKKFFIGDTAIVSANGTENFIGTVLEQFKGNAIADPVLLELGGTSSSTTVNVSLANGIPVTRTGSIPNIDKLDVRLLVSQLLHQTDEGDILRETLEFTIEYRPTSGGAWTFVPGNDNTGLVQKLFDKTTSPTPKEIRFSVPPIEGTYDIRITKLSADSDNNHFTDVGWESFQEVSTTPRTYDNTALILLLARASDQFSSLPQFSGIYKGIKVKVPTIYNPLTRNYDFSGGPWDGTFKIAYTNCGPWVLYDYVMNDRYGMNANYAVTLNKYDVLEAALWADACNPITGDYVGVDDGKGGTQPRYTFNALIAEPRPAREQANFIAGTFNAVLFDDLNGSMSLKVDKDENAVYLFTKENIATGDFTYSFTDISTRFNDITGIFVNPDLDWADDRRRVFNQESIDAHGRIPMDFVAQGALDAQECIRRTTHRMISAQTENMFVSFKTNRRGHYIQPYEMILISDDDLGYGISGRVNRMNADRTKVFLRDPISLEVGVDYNMTVFIDGVETVYPLEEITVAGATRSFNLTTPLSEDVPEFCTFTISQEDGGIGLPKPFRVMSIDESEEDGEIVTITALEVNRLKYTDVDEATFSGTIDYAFNFNPDVIPPATNLTLTEHVRNTSSGVRRDIIGNWTRSASALVREYEVSMSYNGGPFQKMDSTGVNTWTLIDVPDGDYEVIVVAVSLFNKRSAPATAAITIEAPVIPVPDVVNLRTVNGNPSVAGSFYGQDIEIEWDVLPVVPWDGSSAGAPFPYLQHYRVRVYDDVTLLRTETVTEKKYRYTKVMNTTDLTIPKRTISFIVDCVDLDDEIGEQDTLTANNPAPTIGAITLGGGIGMLFIHTVLPTDIDFSGTMIWYDTTSGYTPTIENAKLAGFQSDFAVDVEEGETYYVRIGVYDSFGYEGMSISSELTITSAEIVPEKDFLFSGLLFEPNDPSTNHVSWTGGTVNYGVVGDAPVQKIIAAGSAEWTSGVMNIYYVEGEEILRTTTDLTTAFGSSGRILATYRGGTDLTIGNGDAFFDGSRVIAGTIGADQLVTGSAVITGSAQIANALINNAHINDLSVAKLIAGAITTSGIYLGDAKFELDGANQRIVVKDNQGAPVTRIILGKIGAGTTDFGIEIYDASGALVLSSGSGVPLAGAITGQGAFATLSQITAGNVSTYIANAAIKSAQIETLVADKITTGTLAATVGIGVGGKLYLDGVNGRIVLSD